VNQKKIQLVLRLAKKYLLNDDMGINNENNCGKAVFIGNDFL
jgi:hypothetical protein